MRAQSAVAVSIDRLGAAWLGAYGNTWLETPHFNRLASQSLLCETALVDSPELSGACRAWWTGRHALATGDSAAGAPLPQLAAAYGATSLLVTDDRAVADHPLAASFSRHLFVEQPPALAAAEEPGETGLFRLMLAAAGVLDELHDPFLMWIHSRGMAGPWDAPQPLREQFADEEDPQPPAFVEPPERMLALDYDPDELLGVVHAYAAQVAAADLAVGLLLEALEAHPQRARTLLAFTSPRGFPLGEHRRVGPCDGALYGELLHVPLLLRLPEGRGALIRSQQIVQPPALYAALAEALGWSQDAASRLLAEVDGRLAMPQEVAISTAVGQRSIRTPAWFLRRSDRDGTPDYELFAKPDDRFEANEISSRCHEALDLLAAELESPERATGDGPLAQTSQLPELLTDVWR